MTAAEIQQAEQLARWIDGDRGTLPNEECSVALWAMRPDLAPMPRVSLEDVLARVESGPFASAQSVSEDDFEEQDFVEAIFLQSRIDTPSQTSLQDIFDRIESGPLAADPVEASTTSTPAIEPNATSANNNRWWKAPWLAGGLAAALVLFTLIPTQFEAPVSEDSIFAPKFEAEEDWPEEEMEAEMAPRPADQVDDKMDATTKSIPSKKSKQPLAKKSAPSPTQSNNAVENTELEPLREQLPQPGSMGMLGASDVKSQESVPSSAIPNKPSVSQVMESKSVLKDESTNSLDGVGYDSENDYDDLNGIKKDTMTNDYEGGVLDAVGMGNVDPLDEPKGARLAEDVSPLSVSEQAAIPSEEIIVEAAVEEEALDEMVVSRTSLDAVLETSVKEDQGLPRRKKEKSKGILYKAAQAPSADMPAEEPMPVQAEEVYSRPLSTQLSAAQQVAIQNASSIQAVLDMCTVDQPTQSLDILWVASQRFSSAEATTLLKASSQYDHGDVRYLKRNWLALAVLLRQSGQVSEAQKYEQQASSLP